MRRCLECPTLIPSGSRCPQHQRAHLQRRGRSGYARQQANARILERDQYLCRLCFSATATEVDHVVPLYQGGSDSDANKRAVCGPCHKSKSRAERRTG